MHTPSFSSIRFAALSIVAGVTLFAGVLAHADSGSTLDTSSSDSSVSSDDTNTLPISGTGMNILPGQGTITIDQKNGSGSTTIGRWTLIKPDNQQLKSGEPTNTLTNTSAGSYTIFATLPTGASATIRVYRNGKLETLQQRPQATFILQNNDQISVVIHYTIVRVGLVAVDSDPNGITFRMNGPNGSHFTGTTPASFPGVTEGQYQVFYDTLQGCTPPTSKSLRLQAGNRLSFTVKMSCAAADKLRAQQAQQQQGNDMNIMIGSQEESTIVQDVPQDAWFAPYVANVTKYGILSGYRNSAGQLTGHYGPSNNVTVAELAKAAHKIAGISIDAFAKAGPDNPKAQGTWFSSYFASAENRGWTIFNAATIDPARPATRGEVLITLLQALNIPVNWQTGTLFTDVTLRTPYAAAIETATNAKVVEGRTDASGASTNTFGPADPINRAEFAKILSNMIDVYKSGSSSSSSSSLRFR
jgi:hypothetical protein